MGSQYLINQPLYTQLGSQDVCLSVHSSDRHISHSLITCRDTSPLPQKARKRRATAAVFGLLLYQVAVESLSPALVIYSLFNGNATC